MTTMYRLVGQVIETEWYSKLNRGRSERGRAEYFQEGEIRRPVPPPRPDGRGVWENEKKEERAAGVAVFSGVIHVSVRARKSRESREA
uniref:Uncharacterized protein n=1 Tax=Anguilla anguilla TaxID=7936 RepID=A0A0E9W6X6_ANGAN